MPAVICAGLITVDAVYDLDAFPEEGCKVRARTARLQPGGGALLAATTVSKLGGTARLAGAVGDDLFGQFLRGQMTLRGIDHTLVQTLEGETTAHSAVFVTADGERTIVNQRSDRLLDVDLMAGLPDYDAVLADTRCHTMARRLFQQAQREGKPSVLDGEAPVPLDLLPLVSHLALSEQGLADFDGTSLAEIAVQNQSWACVTRGAEDVELHDGSRFVPPHVTPLDTLGAGDVWHGAFAFALAKGLNEPEAVEFSNAAAALFVSRTGAARFPTSREVDDVLQTQR